MATQLTLVVAMDAARGIGVDNQLPWHLPEDLAHFKRVTLGNPIIMGRKTFESIGRPLPGRRNLVVSRNPQWAHPGCEPAASIQDAVMRCAGSPEVFVIGGAQIYQQALNLADRLLITEVDVDAQADTFFETLDPAVWQCIKLEPAVSRTGLNYAIGEWVRASTA